MNLAILSSGMMTGVGLSAPATCAAIRAGIALFMETKFLVRGEPLMGCMVPLPASIRGIVKLTRLVVPAIEECLAGATIKKEQIPLLLCVSDPERPGRLEGIDVELFDAVQAELGVFHPRSAMFANAKVGIALALQRAKALIQNEKVPAVLIAGVDSFLTAATIDGFHEKGRMLAPGNSDGFLPGEAGTAVLVGPSTGGHEMLIRGIGLADEKAPIDSDDPLLAEGLANAFRAACADAGCTMDDVHYRLTDLSGEQYYFKEAALAIARTIRKPKPRFELWHPADCVGEIGAAIGPCVLGVARAAALKNYAPGRGVLCHFSNDDGKRAAIILEDRKG